MKAADEAATITRIEPARVGGAPHVDVVLRFDDGREERALVRADLVPEGLVAGDRVRLTRAALYRRWTLARTAG